MQRVVLFNIKLFSFPKHINIIKLLNISRMLSRSPSRTCYEHGFCIPIRTGNQDVSQFLRNGCFRCFTEPYPSEYD